MNRMRVICRSDYTRLSVNPITMQAPKEWPLSERPFSHWLLLLISSRTSNYIFAYFPLGSSRGEANFEKSECIGSVEPGKCCHEVLLFKTCTDSSHWWLGLQFSIALRFFYFILRVNGVYNRIVSRFFSRSLIYYCHLNVHLVLFKWILQHFLSIAM